MSYSIGTCQRPGCGSRGKARLRSPEGGCRECDAHWFREDRGFNPRSLPRSSRIQWDLETKDVAVVKAVVLLYGEQTAYEARIRATVLDNDRGFNHADAARGSAMAAWILSEDLAPHRAFSEGSSRAITREDLIGEFLAGGFNPAIHRRPKPDDLAWARVAIAKYVRQLTRLAEARKVSSKVG